MYTIKEDTHGKAIEMLAAQTEEMREMVAAQQVRGARREVQDVLVEYVCTSSSHPERWNC